VRETVVNAAREYVNSGRPGGLTSG
jgi:hypothetical protein